MIFASDLDRTLIYSERFLPGYIGKVEAVEQGKYISFMTEKSVELITGLFTQLIFVPCTTRTIEQYRRIRFFNRQYIPKFAVVSNGGNIIVDGVVHEGYRNNIAQKLSDNCLAGSQLLKEFEELASGEWSGRLVSADGLFYYCIIDRAKAPLEQIDAFADWALDQNWEVSLQGRKLYLVPRLVNKWSAVEKIKELTGEQVVFAAGDSLLDLSMIENANQAIYPAHGELYERFGKSLLNSRGQSVAATAVAGLAAAEQILLEAARFKEYGWNDKKVMNNN
jgi:hypothetical protein